MKSECGGEECIIANCCDQCSLPTDDSEHDPKLPEECDCHDCFCCGALPATKVMYDFDLVGLVGFTFIVTDLPRTPAKSLTSQRDRWHSASPIVTTALEVRADLCCWLI